MNRNLFSKSNKHCSGRVLAILLILVMLVLSLATVSAAIYVTPGGSGSQDGSSASDAFATIQLAVLDSTSGDTIELANGIYNHTGDRNIQISHTLTIVGKTKGGVILDAGTAQQRFFDVNSGAIVTFINITFQNGGNGAGIKGGAIYSEGTIRVIDCEFINNTVYAGGPPGGNSGGAIWNSGNNMLIEHCIFINNHAGVSGGAVYSEGGNYNTIKDSEFKNNSARHGGAIDVVNGDYFEISNSRFENNNATGGTANHGGGAIYIHGYEEGDETTDTIYGCNFFKIIECIFIDNYSTGDGGAIANEGKDTTVETSTFTGNNATRNGGAIWNNGIAMEVIDSHFEKNHAENHGGSIYNAEDGTMLVKGNHMTGNSAHLGQMIYNAGNMGVLVLTFIENKTHDVYDGQIFRLYATLTDDMGNTVTWQAVSFVVKGVHEDSLNSIEGIIEFVNYTVRGNPGDLIPVTGNYAGHDGYEIVIKPGLLRILANYSAKVTIDYDKKEYKVGEKVTVTVTAENTGYFTDEDCKVVVTLPDGFVVDPNSFVARHGTYDSTTNTWTIGNLTRGQIEKLTFTGHFTRAGEFPIYAHLSGSNFEPSRDEDKAIVIEPESSSDSDLDTNDPDGSDPDSDVLGETNDGDAGDGETNDGDAGETNDGDADDLSASAAMKKTGVPIITLILLVLSIIGTCVYRKK